jgi:hypothetical protein
LPSWWDQFGFNRQCCKQVKTRAHFRRALANDIEGATRGGHNLKPVKGLAETPNMGLGSNSSYQSRSPLIRVCGASIPSSRVHTITYFKLQHAEHYLNESDIDI